MDYYLDSASKKKFRSIKRVIFRRLPKDICNIVYIYVLGYLLRHCRQYDFNVLYNIFNKVRCNRTIYDLVVFSNINIYPNVYRLSIKKNDHTLFDDYITIYNKSIFKEYLVINFYIYNMSIECKYSLRISNDKFYLYWIHDISNSLPTNSFLASSNSNPYHKCPYHGRRCLNQHCLNPHTYISISLKYVYLDN